MTDFQIYALILASLFSNLIIGIWCYLAGMRAMGKKMNSVEFQRNRTIDDMREQQLQWLREQYGTEQYGTVDATGKLPGSRLQ